MINGTIHLIRHSTTTGIEKRWLYGSAELPVSEAGFALLDELIAEGIYPPADGCDMVSSGMLRANQTLQRIYGDVPFRIEPELREMGVGICECKTHEEMQDNPDYCKWLADTTGEYAVPGGESIHGFYARVISGFSSLLSRAQRNTIAVCHGGVIGAILYNFHCDGEQPPPEKFFTYLPKPARGFTLTIRNGKISDVTPI